MNPVMNGIAAVVSFLFTIIQLLVIASVFVSWVGDRSNPIVQIIFNATEPIYRPIRRFTGRIPGPLDWAPVAVLAIIIFLQYTIIPWLHSLGRGY